MIKIVYFIFFLGIQSFIYAQSIADNQFDSKRLYELYNSLPKQHQSSFNLMPESGVFHLKNVKLPVYFIHNDQGRIKHIGFKLSEKKTEQTLELLFLERYILELILWKDDTLATNRMIADKVEIKLNESAWGSQSFNKLDMILSFLNSEIKTEINCGKDTCFASLVNTSGSSLEFKFRKNRQLLTGKDKVEYGIEVANQLKNYDVVKEKRSFNIDMNVLEKKSDDIWVKKDSSFYVIESLSKNMYLMQDTAHVFRLVHHKDFECESLMNMMLYLNYMDVDTDMDLEHRIYGNELVWRYPVKLNNFLDYFKSEFTFFAGCEEKADIFSYATLLMHNKDLHFVNLLYVEADDRTLFTDSPKWRVKFYTGIPMDNIKNLYGKMYE